MRRTELRLLRLIGQTEQELIELGHEITVLSTVQRDEEYKKLLVLQIALSKHLASLHDMLTLVK